MELFIENRLIILEIGRIFFNNIQKISVIVSLI